VPESTLERLVVVLGICVVAGLVALLVPAWRDYTAADDRSSPAAAPPPAAPSTTDGSRTVAPASSPGPGQIPSTRPATKPATSSPASKGAPPRVARLTLVAANGDCWIEARSGSAAGRTLYFGVLTRGKTVTLTDRVLWLRLGAGENLTARIGKRAIHTLPRGPATIIATPTGVRTLALG
jgi:hypothetical protein